MSAECFLTLRFQGQRGRRGRLETASGSRAAFSVSFHRARLDRATESKQRWPFCLSIDSAGSASRQWNVCIGGKNSATQKFFLLFNFRRVLSAQNPRSGFTPLDSSVRARNVAAENGGKRTAVKKINIRHQSSDSITQCHYEILLHSGSGFQRNPFGI